MKLACFKEGDWVAIPVPTGLFGIARVVHVSERYKDAIGVIVLGMFRDHGRNSVSTARLTVPDPAKLMYTNIKAAKQYSWVRLDFEPLTADESVLSQRIVGGAVWVGDTYVRAATRDDETTLPTMLVYGMIAFYTEVTKLFS